MVFSNPLTADRLNKLREEATNLLKQFGLFFLKNYGSIVLDKVIKELTKSTSENEQLKLTYRPVLCLNTKLGTQLHDGLHNCECYVKTGNGPGTFGGWKKVFVAEQDDHSINIYSDEKAYNAGKKPISRIRPAGYKAVVDVSQHYADALRDVGRGLGLTELEVQLLTRFSPYSWALAHPQRTNYIFQLHKPKSGPVQCLRRGASAEPDDAGFERRDEIINNLSWMKTCVAVSNARQDDAEGISRQAFRRTCKQLPEKIANLKGWSDNGSETEILIDLLVEALLPSLRDPIFNEIVGPTSIKLAVWNKVVGVITKILTTITEPAWEALQEQAKKLELKIEQAVRPAFARILDIRARIEEKIKARSSRQFDMGLSSQVTPFIQPIFDAFEHPLKKGFELERGVLRTKLNLQLMPTDQAQCRDYLDNIVKSTDITSNVKLLTRELVEPLKILTASNPETFQNIDIDLLTHDAELLLLQTLDAAAYTVSVQLDKKEQLTNKFLQELLLNFDHDVVIKRCIFVKGVAEKILVPVFQNFAAPVVTEVVAAMDNVIPEEMKEYLNIESILDAFVEKLGMTAIDKVFVSLYHPRQQPLPPSLPAVNTLDRNLWFFSDIDRDTAMEKVQALREDGAFLVRKSETGGEDAPYTLCVLYRGRACNIQIHRRTTDGKFVLGQLKDTKYVFNSVEEMIAFHKINTIELLVDQKAGGIVTLTRSPKK